MKIELHKTVSFDDLKRYIHTGVEENIKQSGRSVKEYIEWRVRDWEDLCRELTENGIDDFEDILSDSEQIRSFSNVFYSLNAWEIRRFIRKRISELKALEKVTPYEEVWEWQGSVDFYGHTLVMR